MPASSIELRHINYVVAASEHGSFRRAAAALGVQESAISRRVRDLEIRLGTSLFIRSHSGVVLTHAGKQFVERGRKALAEVGLAKTEALAVGKASDGELSIGLQCSLGSGVLFGLLHGFSARYVSVGMSVVDGDQVEHIAAIRQRRLDVAFVSGTVQWEGCEVKHLWSEKVFVALPGDHPLARSEELKWGDLIDERFIVSDGAPGQEIYNYLIQKLAGPGLQPEILSFGIGKDNILSLVALGQGLTLISESNTATLVPGVVFRPIGNEALPYSMVWSARNENPALLRFLDIAASLATQNVSLVTSTA